MPWFQDIETARAIAAAHDRSSTVSRLAFFEGIRDRSADELAASFAGEPVVDDPRHGRIAGTEAFGRYVGEMRSWLASETTGAIQNVRVTRASDRSVEEVEVGLPGDHPELPVAIVSDVAVDGRLLALRVYHSLWPLTGDHAVRRPLLKPDPSIVLDGAPADYQRGLSIGDADATVVAFEPDGEVREPAGGRLSYRGEAHRRIYDLMFANGGGIPLRFCTVIDDGVARAIEYICDQWGRERIPAQAGVAV